LRWHLQQFAHKLFTLVGHRVMSMARTILSLALAMALLGVAIAAPPPTTHDGLVLTSAKGVDVLYRRPDATLAGYTKVMLSPTTVAFSKSWNPRNYGTFGLSVDDVNKMRTGLASLADSVFAKVLTDGGYPVVTTPDAGVLQVVPAIVDLYVNAPDADQPGRTRTYVLSAGSMRLTFELRDAVTGLVLFRGSDLKRDPEMRPLQWASGAYNRAKAETALRGWATQLKEALDAAKAATASTASN
jgi:hypothetical protein